MLWVASSGHEKELLMAERKVLNVRLFEGLIAPVKPLYVQLTPLLIVWIQGWAWS